MNDPKAEFIVDGLMWDIASELVMESLEVLSVMGSTNAYSWDWDYGYKDLKARFAGYGKIAFSVNVGLSGDHDIDKPFCGDHITTQVKGTLKYEDKKWKLDSYDVEEVNLTEYNY